MPWRDSGCQLLPGREPAYHSVRVNRHGEHLEYELKCAWPPICKRVRRRGQLSTLLFDASRSLSRYR